MQGGSVQQKLLNSKEWIQLENETEEIFNARKRDQLKEFDKDRKKHGILVFEFETKEEMYYKEVKAYRYSRMIPDEEIIINNYCKICHNTSIMKGFNPNYPEGFVDGGGVCINPCICVLRGLVKEKKKESKKTKQRETKEHWQE